MRRRPDSAGSLIAKGKQFLKDSGIKNARLEVEIILSSLLKVERYQLYLADIRISPRLRRKFFNILQRRRKHIPIAYLLGHAYFYNRLFKLRNGVPIPRPETELIIVAAIELLGHSDAPYHFLDIGTGSGNIAITLALEFPNSRVLATESSRTSIRIARENAAIFKVSRRVKIQMADLFPARGMFDLIAANPPYLSAKEYRKVPPEVRMEPKSALYGGKDGLNAIRKILERAPLFLKKNGILLLEISPSQSEFFKKNSFPGITLDEIRKDLSGMDRILVFHRTT